MQNALTSQREVFLVAMANRIAANRTVALAPNVPADQSVVADRIAAAVQSVAADQIAAAAQNVVVVQIAAADQNVVADRSGAAAPNAVAQIAQAAENAAREVRISAAALVDPRARAGQFYRAATALIRSPNWKAASTVVEQVDCDRFAPVAC